MNYSLLFANCQYKMLIFLSFCDIVFLRIVCRAQTTGVRKMTKTESSVIAKRIGLNITNLLISEGKAQDDLAKALGVSKSTVSLWCAGRRTPRMQHIDKIAEYFGTTRSAILEDGKAQPRISDQMREEINRLVDERIQNQNADVRADGQPPEYYVDSTVRRITEVMRTNPDSRVIFDAMTTLKSEDLKLIAKLIEKMSD